MADFTQIIEEINTNLPDNTSQSITAAKLRTTLIDLTEAIDTTIDNFEAEYTQVEVVDALNSDSSTAALAANQGKKIAGNLESNYLLPLSQIPVNGIFITGQGAVQSSTTNGSFTVPINGINSISIQTSSSSYYAWLTSNTLTVGQSAPFVTGTSRTSLSPNSGLVNLTIPTGAKYLWVGGSGYLTTNPITHLILNGLDLVSGTLKDKVLSNEVAITEAYNNAVDYSDRIIEDLPDNYLFYFKPVIGRRYNTTGTTESADASNKSFIIRPVVAPFGINIVLGTGDYAGVGLNIYYLNQDGTVASYESAITTNKQVAAGTYFKASFYVRGGYDIVFNSENIYDYVTIQKNIVSDFNWLALGDSLTYGVYSYPDGTGSGSSTDDSKTYVARLQQLLGYNLTNKGIGGMGWVQRSSSAGRIWNLKEQLSITNPSTDEVIRFYVDAADYDLITIFLGVNDWKQPQQSDSSVQATLDNVEANMRWCFDKLISENQNIKIIVFSPINSAWEISTNPSTKANSFAMGYNGGYNGYTMNELVTRMKSVCESYGIEFHDMLHNSIINISNIGYNTSLLPDNVHPSLTGHKLIAEDMYRFMGGKI